MKLPARANELALVLTALMPFWATSMGCSQSEIAKVPPTANIKRASAVEKSREESAPTDKSAEKRTNASDNAPGKSAESSPTADQEHPAAGDTGSADKLIAELRKLDQVRLEEDTPEAKAKFVGVQKQILDMADKALANKGLKEETRLEVISTKWYAALLLVKLGDDGAEDRFMALANELAKDKNPMLAKSARVQLQQLGIMQAMSDLLAGKIKNTDKLLQDIEAMLAEEGLREMQFDLLRNAARVLEAVGKYDEAGRIYSGMMKAFAGSKDPQLALQVEQVAKLGELRLGLIGKEAKVNGTRLDGEPFDLAELKGKVVLVDFWATWCGPCLAELPNVMENYKKYHDRGFDVVGISLDSDKDQLHRFAGGENSLKEKLPWTTLFWQQPSEEADPYDNPLAKKYGVDGIPSTFLVDQQGKIIALSVRGERLGEKLAELLGPPDEVADSE